MYTVKAIFIGDEPTGRTRTPFRHAKCAARLLEWIDYLIEDKDYVIINQSDYTVEDIQDVWVKYDYPLVIALGNKAYTKVKHLEAFKLPHPSGLNRQINDKANLTRALMRCKAVLG